MLCFDWNPEAKIIIECQTWFNCLSGLFIFLSSILLFNGTFDFIYYIWSIDKMLLIRANLCPRKEVWFHLLWVNAGIRFQLNITCAMEIVCMPQANLVNIWLCVFYNKPINHLNTFIYWCSILPFLILKILHSKIQPHHQQKVSVWVLFMGGVCQSCLCSSCASVSKACSLWCYHVL